MLLNVLRNLADLGNKIAVIVFLVEHKHLRQPLYKGFLAECQSRYYLVLFDSMSCWNHGKRHLLIERDVRTRLDRARNGVVHGAPPRASHHEHEWLDALNCPDAMGSFRKLRFLADRSKFFKKDAREFLWEASLLD